MNTEGWRILSDWHNAWLAADASGRQRLRNELNAQSPELAAEADKLVATAESLTGFLETPAFVITAAFATAWLAVLKMIGIQPGALPFENAAPMLSLLVLPLLLAVLVPWSLGRYRHF